MGVLDFLRKFYSCAVFSGSRILKYLLLNMVPEAHLFTWIHANVRVIDRNGKKEKPIPWRILRNFTNQIFQNRVKNS